MTSGCRIVISILVFSGAVNYNYKQEYKKIIEEIIILASPPETLGRSFGFCISDYTMRD